MPTRSGSPDAPPLFASERHSLARPASQLKERGARQAHSINGARTQGERQVTRGARAPPPSPSRCQPRFGSRRSPRKATSSLPTPTNSDPRPPRPMLKPIRLRLSPSPSPSSSRCSWLSMARSSLHSTSAFLLSPPSETQQIGLANLKHLGGASSLRPTVPCNRRRLGAAPTSPNKTRCAATTRAQRALLAARAATRNSARAPSCC